MAPKQRQIRIEQRGGLAAMQELESRSDDELERETRNRAAARAILGARAADRYDADAARQYFRQAIAAARPQERMQLRRMADASLPLAERRAGDLKDPLQKLGQEALGRRQLWALALRARRVAEDRAPLQRRARGRCRRRDPAPRARAGGNAAALGPGAALGRRSEGRLPHDQRAGGVDRRAPGVPARLRAPSLPDRR